MWLGSISGLAPSLNMNNTLWKCLFMLQGGRDGRTQNKQFVCMRVCAVRGILFDLAFNNFSVISGQCLDVAGTSDMSFFLFFIILPQWNRMSKMPILHDTQSLTLGWKFLVPLLSAKWKHNYFTVSGMIQLWIKPLTSCTCSRWLPLSYHSCPIILWTIQYHVFTWALLLEKHYFLYAISEETDNPVDLHST